MILVVYGTTGELIKLAPVLLRLRDRGLPYVSACTGQQVSQIPALLDSLSLSQPDLWLGAGAGGRDLRSTGDIPRWLASITGQAARRSSETQTTLRAGPGTPFVLVHGDTFTTVFGAAWGRLLRIPVGHVEGGLRSFDLLHPFPEELDRRITSRLAHIHYAPGNWAASNLRRGVVVNTGSNTIRDSLALCPERSKGIADLGKDAFGLVSLHRFELLNNRPLLAATLDVLQSAASRTQLLFIDHPVTVAAIHRHGLEGMLGELQRIPRLGFLDFIPLLRHSRFLVADRGGNQEETFYLDKPCLIHRKRTERREGIGENVVLSGYDLDVLRDFLRDPGRHRRRAKLPVQSPSEVIVDDLATRAYSD